MLKSLFFSFFFFFNDTATTEIYTLSLHDALPICSARASSMPAARCRRGGPSASRTNRARRSSAAARAPGAGVRDRSEEHTSELQSRLHLVCRLLLEKKKKKERHARSTWNEDDVRP